MENKKIKNVPEVDLAILNFIRQMVKSGYGVCFNRFQAVDNLSFTLKIANQFHQKIACIECNSNNELSLSIGNDMWALDEMSDLTFAVMNCTSFMDELKKLFKYDEH